MPLVKPCDPRFGTRGLVEQLEEGTLTTGTYPVGEGRDRNPVQGIKVGESFLDLHPAVASQGDALAPAANPEEFRRTGRGGIEE